jgi:CNT family concentrative nucleoside transporter
MEGAALALQSALGVVLIPALAWAMSEDRCAYTATTLIRIVAVGLAIQFALAILFLHMPWTKALFETIAAGVQALQAASDAGTRLVFGYLAGAPAPFEQRDPQAGFILAFRVLPLILLMSALTRLLYHWGVLQRIVQAAAFALQRTLGTSGPLAVSAAGSIFLGLIEAPLLIRPYLREMSRGALFAAMAVAMATVAGTVLAIYASILSNVVPGAAGHLIAASVINVPGALVLARLAVPEGFADGPATANVTLDDAPQSSMDAIAQGTADGIRMVAAVAGTLIVMIALVALVNMMLASLGSLVGVDLSLEQILGFLCVLLALIIGIPAAEAGTAASLIGQKIVLNEFLAYLELLKLPPEALSPRSELIVTYALCGFANLGSLGILIGGMTILAPERRAEVAALAPKALVIGVLATLLTAAIVGTTVWR